MNIYINETINLDCTLDELRKKSKKIFCNEYTLESLITKKELGIFDIEYIEDETRLRIYPDGDVELRINENVKILDVFNDLDKYINNISGIERFVPEKAGLFAEYIQWVKDGKPKERVLDTDNFYIKVLGNKIKVDLNTTFEEIPNSDKNVLLMGIRETLETSDVFWTTEESYINFFNRDKIIHLCISKNENIKEFFDNFNLDKIKKINYNHDNEDNYHYGKLKSKNKKFKILEGEE